jgi:hypothetical protein
MSAFLTEGNLQQMWFEFRNLLYSTFALPSEVERLMHRDAGAAEAMNRRVTRGMEALAVSFETTVANNDLAHTTAMVHTMVSQLTRLADMALDQQSAAENSAAEWRRQTTEGRPMSASASNLNKLALRVEAIQRQLADTMKLLAADAARLAASAQAQFPTLPHALLQQPAAQGLLAPPTGPAHPLMQQLQHAARQGGSSAMRRLPAATLQPQANLAQAALAQWPTRPAAALPQQQQPSGITQSAWLPRPATTLPQQPPQQQPMPATTLPQQPPQQQPMPATTLPRQQQSGISQSAWLPRPATTLPQQPPMPATALPQQQLTWPPLSATMQVPAAALRPQQQQGIAPPSWLPPQQQQQQQQSIAQPTWLHSSNNSSNSSSMCGAGVALPHEAAMHAIRRLAEQPTPAETADHGQRMVLRLAYSPFAGSMYVRRDGSLVGGVNRHVYTNSTMLRHTFHLSEVGALSFSPPFISNFGGMDERHADAFFFAIGGRGRGSEAAPRTLISVDGSRFATINDGGEISVVAVNSISLSMLATGGDIVLPLIVISDNGPVPVSVRTFIESRADVMRLYSALCSIGMCRVVVALDPNTV